MVSLCFCVWMLAGCGSKQDKTTTWQHIQWLKKCRKQWKDIKGFRLQSRSWFNGLLVWVEVHKCRWRTGNSCMHPVTLWTHMKNIEEDEWRWRQISSSFRDHKFWQTAKTQHGTTCYILHVWDSVGLCQGNARPKSRVLTNKLNTRWCQRDAKNLHGLKSISSQSWHIWTLELDFVMPWPLCIWIELFWTSNSWTFWASWTTWTGSRRDKSPLRSGAEVVVQRHENLEKRRAHHSARSNFSPTSLLHGMEDFAPVLGRLQYLPSV